MRFALSFLAEMIPYMLLALPFYLGVRALLLRRRHTPLDWRREALLLVFFLYCVGLASQTVMPQMVQDADGSLVIFTIFTNNPHFPSVGGFSPWRFNLIPFHTIKIYLERAHIGIFLVNIVGNILMFAPIGFCVPLLWRRMRGFLRITLLGVAVSCGIELLQILMLRSVDIDDVILNSLGVILGYLLYLPVAKRYALTRKKA